MGPEKQQSATEPFYTVFMCGYKLCDTAYGDIQLSEYCLKQLGFLGCLRKRHNVKKTMITTT